MTHVELIVLNYLLNALWQIPVVFLAAAVAARLTRAAGPQVEHRIWVVALVLEAVLPACAFFPALREIFSSFFHHSQGSVAVQTTLAGAAPDSSNPHIAAILAPIALVVYIAVVVLFSARLAVRIYRTRSLRHVAQSITLAGEPLAIWQRCTNLFGIHHAELATSAAIGGPSTIGVRHRVVLLPPSLLTSLSQEDLAAALAHEFAHMRRRDFAKNLLYEIIALPIAWHPLLWLTRPHIAATREMVCDELAAQATHGTTRYAHSLLRIAASFAGPTSTATFQAIGILDGNVLERRIMTLNRKRSIAATSRRVVAASVVLFGAVTCATAMSLRYEIPAEAILRSYTGVTAHTVPASGAQQSAGPVKIAAGVVAGQIISRVNPIYPPEAREKGIQGAVVLHAVIGRDGTIQNLAVISGPEELQASAVDAVKQWVYQPYLLNGEPVEVDTTVTVNYSLGQKTPLPPPQAPGNPNEDSYQITGPDGVYNIGGSVRPPIATFTADPEYSESAKKAKLSGNVIVGLVVDSSGEPQNVHVERGLGNELDEKAVEAVQQYRFKPATRNGEPVPVNLKVEVNFRIY